MTPDRDDEHLHGDSTTLERGFVASLRWLVSEGGARGVRRIAVELRALQEALATLDETRTARDEHVRRNAELEREISAAVALLGPGTAINGNGSLVQRLTRLRDRLRDDNESRRQLVIERDAWRTMTTLMTQTRAYVHELLEQAERSRDDLSAELLSLKDQVLELQISREHAEQDRRIAESALTSLRDRLQGWSTTVERAVHQLSQTTSEMAAEQGMILDERRVTPTYAPVADAQEPTHAPSHEQAREGSQAHGPVHEPVQAPGHRRPRIRRTFLSLADRAQLRPARRPRRQALWLLIPAPTVEEWRHLYAAVGAQWQWTDRNKWSDARLAERLSSKNVHIFRADAALNGLSDDIESGIGFVELEMHSDHSVEIVFFGLTPSAQGFGLGAWMLERAVEEAWGLGATRVWLHTCTLDAPHALPNYIARGFTVDREEEYDAD